MNWSPRWVAAKLPQPEGVRQHDDTVHSLRVIARIQQASGKGSDSQNAEVIGGHRIQRRIDLRAGGVLQAGGPLLLRCDPG
jgi:hypothetical protein